MDDKIVDVLKDKEEDTSIQGHLIYSRCLLLTLWRIHGADGRRDKFHTKSGLTRLKKGSPFRHQTIEFGISMTKIVPKEPRETNKHAKGEPETEWAILWREATSSADSSSDPGARIFVNSPFRPAQQWEKTRPIPSTFAPDPFRAQ